MTIRRAGAAVACVGAAAMLSNVRVPAQTATSPDAAVERLLAADRTFAAASAKTNAVSALTAMFATDVTMAVPGGRFATGQAEVTAALRANPENGRARLQWQPLRGGISADGRHGFTFGYMTERSGAGVVTGMKYLAYWVRQPEGWRVMAYRRRRRPEGPVSTAMMAPALPPRMTTSMPDAATLAKYHESLDHTERAFSTEAQRIGIGAAFAKYGSADAVNMGGPEDAAFVVGSEAIGRSVSAGSPGQSSPVSWGPDRVVVASSGDLGITFGMIRSNGPDEKGQTPPPVPFFTIWRRQSVSDPWRYVAE